MAKLVIQSAEQKGRSYELKVDKTTVGRLEDNTFQIADASVSSHHCEILLRGTDVVIKDLNSTNGTFINDDKITESVLKPGQKLRLGQIELCLESGDATATTTTASTMFEPVDAVRDATGAIKQVLLVDHTTKQVAIAAPGALLGTSMRRQTRAR